MLVEPLVLLVLLLAEVGALQNGFRLPQLGWNSHGP
jgi:hypothetical protein